MIVAVLLIGTITIIYFRDVVRQNIWDDNLSHAKAISALTYNYMDLAKLYLESQGNSYVVVNAVSDKNMVVLDKTLQSIYGSGIFDFLFITDGAGTVISSYPYSKLAGNNYLDMPYISDVAYTGKAYIGDSKISEVTQRPTIYISTPIKRNDRNVSGVLVGGIDLGAFSDYVLSTQVKDRQYIYMVNRTSHVMLHSNREYVDVMKNFSTVPPVQIVTEGKEGVMEYYNPIELDTRLAAYSPIRDHGWGVIVALPIDVAYRPISNSVWVFIALFSMFLLLSAILLIVIRIHLVDPIVSMSKAASMMPYGDYGRYLPEGRGDEIGELARSFDSMARTIRRDREDITKAKDHAEEEKNRSDFYLDVMGHDINNLNQTIMMSLELMKNDKNLSEEQRNFIERALKAATGGADIIKNVRNLQKMGEEQPLEIVDIDRMISDCIKEAPRLANKKVVINYSPRKGMLVKGIPLMKEIFCNLISNSVKYSGEEVNIDIASDDVFMDDRKFYRITISDNGYGIPDDIKPKLFRKFQRGTTKADGKGLGLYIVKTLVERFGGPVRIEDRVPGDYAKGCKFIVLLPAADEGEHV